MSERMTDAEVEQAISEIKACTTLEDLQAASERLRTSLPFDLRVFDRNWLFSHINDADLADAERQIRVGKALIDKHDALLAEMQKGQA